MRACMDVGDYKLCATCRCDGVALRQALLGCDIEHPRRRKTAKLEDA